MEGFTRTESINRLLWRCDVERTEITSIKTSFSRSLGRGGGIGHCSEVKLLNFKSKQKLKWPVCMHASLCCYDTESWISRF